MAFKTKAAPVKEAEVEKGKRPDFVIRSRQSPDSDFFVTIGAAWEVEVKGEKAFSVRLHTVPTNWDGSCLMLPPLADKE